MTKYNEQVNLKSKASHLMRYKATKKTVTGQAIWPDVKQDMQHYVGSKRRRKYLRKTWGKIL